jgi:predicted metal-dependent hydrolase
MAGDKIRTEIKCKNISPIVNFNEFKIRKLEKRWGSCTPSNKIIISIDAIKLPFSLIDYLIVHELVHTKIKNHSKEFWAELSKHIPNWKDLDSKMYGMKL